MGDFNFGSSSEKRLKTVSPLLQKIMRKSLETSLIDFGIPQHGGKRTASEQCELFKQGLSKCDGVKKLSRHQSGNAIDIVAFVNGYTYDQKYYYMLGHHILQTAKSMGITNLRWGGDWDGDFDLSDQTFNDLVHFELV